MTKKEVQSDVRSDQGQADQGRRNFLKLATVAPAAAAAAVVTPGTEAEAAAEPQGNGLRKTAHVKAYLDSARF